MLLFHGSYVEIKEPKIIKSYKGRDFGYAFYLTEIKEQAERMAKRKIKEIKLINQNIKPIVNIYKWDENKKNLKFKEYKNADINWLNMIINCRSNPNFKHGFDIVKGKIADDSVGETITFVQKGIMRKEDAISKLKFQKINNQIAFCTDKAISKLKFVKSYEVK